jgi:ACR3 family arsenite efflux pump ArsB
LQNVVVGKNGLFQIIVYSSLSKFFSYLVAVTITGDSLAASFDLWLALLAFSSDSSFTCHICCNTGTLF